MKIYSFNPGFSGPFIHLAHANGFLPLTYAPFLNGFLSSYRVFSILPRFLNENMPAVRLGHWRQMADDLIDGLREQKVQDCIGIGHSLGGVLTLYAAVKQPKFFKAVVLLDPTMLEPKALWKIHWTRFLGLEMRRELVQGALKRRRHWKTQEEAWEHFKAKPFFQSWPDETLEAYVQSMVEPDTQGGWKLAYPVEWEARIYQTIPTDVWKIVRGLRLPALVVRGQNSKIFTRQSEEVFRERCPGALFETISDAGHLFPQEKPETTAGILKGFLQKLS